MKAVAATGVPSSPASSTARAVCTPVPRTVSGAQPTRPPACFGRVEDGSGLSRGRGQGLLAVDVLARGDRGMGDLGVGGGDGQVEDEVDVVGRAQL